MTRELHPLCTLFPRLAGAAFDALVADIKANGLRSPIVLHDEMILDGGNRYRACEAAGVEPQFERFAGGNPVSFVLSVNLHRRHMSAGQQAAIVASATDWAKAQTHGGNRKRDQGEGLHLETVKGRAAVAGATTRTQKDADKLARENPARAKDVAQGKTSLYRAVQENKPATPKPAAKPKKTKLVQAAIEPDPDLETPAEMMADMQKDIERLTGLLAAADAQDQKAEVLKWRRAYDAAVRSQSDAMDRAHKSVEREKWIKKQLMRCGKAVGEDDEFKIAPAVEAMARSLKVAA